MSDKSAIEWTDATWNFLVGCDKVSEGCRNCYAIRSVARMSGNPQFGARYRGLVTTGRKPLNWTGEVAFIHGALMKPLSWARRRRIFVNSLSDLFHPAVPDEWIDQAFAVMARCPQHTFQVLTKRPERMAAYISAWDVKLRVQERQASIPAVGGHWVGTAEWPLPNVWLGTSTEDQKTADERIPHLLGTPAAVRFLSCEPLLGPVRLRRSWLGGCDDRQCGDSTWDHACSLGGPAIGWVIVGGESGPKARPMHPEWARSLRDQCQAAGIPFFFKQWGGATAKADGRGLDGRTWDEMPPVAGAGA